MGRVAWRWLCFPERSPSAIRLLDTSLTGCLTETYRRMAVAYHTHAYEVVNLRLDRHRLPRRFRTAEGWF